MQTYAMCARIPRMPAMYVSAYLEGMQDICPLFQPTICVCIPYKPVICVLISRTRRYEDENMPAIYVSSYLTVHVFAYPANLLCVLIPRICLQDVSSYLRVSSYLYKCSHIYICVLIPICPHTHTASARARAPSVSYQALATQACYVTKVLIFLLKEKFQIIFFWCECVCVCVREREMTCISSAVSY